MDVMLTHHDGRATREMAEAVVTRFAKPAFADKLDIPFFSSARFAERLQGHIAAKGFSLVLSRGESGQPDSPLYDVLILDLPLPGER